MTHETDLSNATPDVVINKLDALLQRDDVVLHGTGTNHLYLKPMPAFDFYRGSGRNTAVYATTVAGHALKFALYNRRLAWTIATLTNDIEVSTSRTTNGFDATFAFKPTVYNALSNHGTEPTDLLRDGFIHVLPKAAFLPVPDDRYEWTCCGAVQPQEVIRISRSIGQVLFGNVDSRFTTRSYTSKELDERRAIYANLQ